MIAGSKVQRDTWMQHLRCVGDTRGAIALRGLARPLSTHSIRSCLGEAAFHVFSSLFFFPFPFFGHGREVCKQPYRRLATRGATTPPAQRASSVPVGVARRDSGSSTGGSDHDQPSKNQPSATAFRHDTAPGGTQRTTWGAQLRGKRSTTTGGFGWLEEKACKNVFFGMVAGFQMQLPRPLHVL